MTSHVQVLHYEDFGAVGDGVHDDLAAIKATHEHANEQGLPVRSQPEACYHLGKQALTVSILTDTDWNTSRFSIDDREVENHQAPLFVVGSKLVAETLNIHSLKRDQKHLDNKLTHEHHVLVENDRVKRYIRRGLNQNSGVAQSDCFILKTDGSIEGAIDWDYEHISSLQARPIDSTTLRLKGGVFTTFANCMKQEVGYNYWARNIVVNRSNTLIEGLTHYVVAETSVGHPYRGFISIEQCANITLRDCFFSAHKIYSTIGAAGKPVNMGSYDVHANHVVNLALQRCHMNHICDATRWGVIASNHCKNILLEDCKLSRMDTHMGVSGYYTIRRCQLGHMGLNAIGRGLLSVEDSHLHGRAFIRFRDDYGSTWEGKLVIRNCTWTPSCGKPGETTIIHVTNDGRHDFGYPCSMPYKIEIDGLHINDQQHPADEAHIYLISDPEHVRHVGEYPVATDVKPFPYRVTQTMTLRQLSSSSGRSLVSSANPEVAKAVNLQRQDD